MSTNRLFREFPFRQGRIDFVAANGIDELRKWAETIQPAFAVNPIATSEIMSLLKNNSPRTRDYLFQKCDVSKPIFERVFNTLVDSRIVSKTKTQSYSLATPMPNVELFAIELKLHNWRRALYQAMQAKAYSNVSITVFPKERVESLNRVVEKFKTYGIGVGLFDYAKSSLKWLSRPHKASPGWKSHYCYAAIKLAAKCTDSPPIHE